MSTNLEIIKNAYVKGGPALFAALAPDVEWTQAEGFPYNGTFRSPDEITKKLFSRLGSEWEGFKAESESFHDAGDTIIVTGSYRGKYRSTGRSMVASFAHLLTMKDSKIVRFVQYVDSKKVWDAMDGE